MHKLLVSMAVGVFSFGVLSSSHAGTFTTKCPDIASCAQYVSDLLGQKYVFEPTVVGKLQTTTNVDISKDNAESLFTYMLYINGFTRVPQGLANSYQILRQRDAKDLNLPLYEATDRIAPAFPGHWDFANMRYKAAHAELANEMTRILRNLMPPNTRIMSVDWSGEILATDCIPNLRKIYDLLKTMDIKPTAELKKHFEQMKKERAAAQARTAEKKE